MTILYSILIIVWATAVPIGLYMLLNWVIERKEERNRMAGK